MRERSRPRALLAVRSIEANVTTMDEHPTTTIGILHPGAMGAAIGASARQAGARVLWVSEGRSTQTAARAEEAGLVDVHWLNGLVNQSRIVVSVCPPHAAEEMAKEVALVGYEGLYVDANAIAPASARRVCDIVEARGASFVDGGIIGPPPWRPGTTRLYLSGEAAPKVARYFEGGPLEVQVLDAPVGVASALKMAYAAYTKGTSALLAAIIALAEHEGVHDALFAEWRRGDQDLAAEYAQRVRAAAPKAWRYAGEMDEVAATFAAAGLPSGFHEAAAAVYRRLEAYKDDSDPPSAEELARALLGD